MAIVARDLHSSLNADGFRWGQGVPPANCPFSGFSFPIQLYVHLMDYIRILLGFHVGVLAGTNGRQPPQAGKKAAQCRLFCPRLCSVASGGAMPPEATEHLNSFGWGRRGQIRAAPSRSIFSCFSSLASFVVGGAAKSAPPTTKPPSHAS